MKAVKHKAYLLTKEQVSKGRSNAYNYLDLSNNDTNIMDSDSN